MSKIVIKVNNAWVCRMLMRSPVGIDTCVVIDKYKRWKLGDCRCVEITRLFVLVDHKYAELDVVVNKVY
jgi:hypothetical protein